MVTTIESLLTFLLKPVEIVSVQSLATSALNKSIELTLNLLEILQNIKDRVKG